VIIDHVFSAYGNFPVTLNVKDDRQGVNLSQVALDYKCTSPAVMISQTAGTVANTSLSGSKTNGQGFIADSNFYMTSISVEFKDAASTAGKATLRFGTTKDLSRSFDAEVTIPVIPNSWGDFIFPNVVKLIVGTQYYWEVVSTDGSYANRFQLAYVARDVYLSGNREAAFFTGANPPFTLDTGDLTRDFNFKISGCR